MGGGEEGGEDSGERRESDNFQRRFLTLCYPILASLDCSSC